MQFYRQIMHLQRFWAAQLYPRQQKQPLRVADCLKGSEDQTAPQVLRAAHGRSTGF
jgi:hypothetical protein